MVFVLLTYALAATAGGFREIEETARGQKVASLAAFAFKSVAGASNSLDLQGKSFKALTSASSQVVSGVNYRLSVALEPAGSVEFVIYEQSWTKTLQITSASLQPSDASNAMLDLIGGNAMSLDAESFAQFHASEERVASSAPLGQDGHGQHHVLGEDGHGQQHHTLGEDGHGQQQHLLGENGHGQQHHTLGENGHGQYQPPSGVKGAVKSVLRRLRLLR